VPVAGTNLAEVQFAQFIPLRQDRLLRLLGLPRISARELEQQICLASNHPGATAPALDSLLHAVIPAKYVDQIGATKK
jgi:rhamnose utilization protein RhaD (predicted bifunctional aldolase and dehydrogenase)